MKCTAERHAEAIKVCRAEFEHASQCKFFCASALHRGNSIDVGQSIPCPKGTMEHDSLTMGVDTL